MQFMAPKTINNCNIKHHWSQLTVTNTVIMKNSETLNYQNMKTETQSE